MKGQAWIIALILGVIVIAGIGTMYLLAVTPAVPVVAPEYTGEFDDAFLATQGWFYSDFTEQVDCNISSDVLGVSTYDSCIYRTRVALNATADTSIDSRDWVLALAIDIDDDVEDMDIDIDTAAGTSTTGVPADDVSLSQVKLYTHEDEPVLVADFTNEIDDQQDLDTETGPLAGDEYVLYMVWHTKSVSPAFTAGDDVARVDLDLDTSGDTDAARITVESA